MFVRAYIGDSLKKRKKRCRCVVRHGSTNSMSSDPLLNSFTETVGSRISLIKWHGKGGSIAFEPLS